MVERDINFRLIKEIERHPLLYNYTLEEYSNKSLNEKAWKEVGRKTNMSVGECKEKWRNIRSTFNRSKKPLPQGFRAKKSYYLSRHLAFILPFMRKLASTPGPGIRAREEENNETQEMEASEDENSDPDFAIDVTNVSTVDHASHSFAGSSPASQRTEDTKRHTSEVDNTLIEYLKEHRSGTETQSTPTSPMQHFFLSLMGEFDNMTEQEIRHFKIKVLQLIDEIKTNPVVKSEFQATVSPEPSYE